MMYVDFAVRFVIAMLLAGLWQAPLFALAAWAVLRVNASANATTRHSVLAAALFASSILPVATATLAMQHAGVIATAANDSGDVELPKGARSYVPVDPRPSLPEHTRVPSSTTPPVSSGQAPRSITIPSVARFNISLPRWLALAVAVTWFASAALVMLRLAFSLAHLERLKRDALPLDVDYRSGLTRWAAATKGSRNVRLCIADEIDIPIAVGLFDAMILVPKRLLAELAPHDIDAIVLHELAHLRRSDDWINAAERVANALLFFNPGVIWLASQLDLEREVACDDWVLQQNDALPYATCLAKVAETAVWPHRPMTAPGAFVTRRGMSIRIERLLAKHRDVRVRTSFGLATAAVALLGILGFVAAFVSPSIAYDAMELPAHVAAVAPPMAVAETPRSRGERGERGKRRPATGPHREREAVRSGASQSDRLALGAGPAIASIDAGGRRSVVSARVAGGAANRSAYRSASANHSSNASGKGAQAVTSDSDEPAATEVPKPPAAHRANKRLVAGASDSDFIDQLESAGYTKLTIDQLIQLKAAGVSAEFIRGLQKHGLTHPSVDELVRLRAIDVSPSYIAEMRERYGASFGLNDIVSLRAAGVSDDYIGSLSSAGLGDLSAEDVRKLRTLGVSPDFVKALSDAGYSGLSADDIASLRAIGITSGYIHRLQSLGADRPSVSDLRSMRAVDVDPAYVAAMRERFGDSLSLDDITGMRAVGVTTSYCSELSAAGLKDLSPEHVRSLRALGVTPDFVRELARAGYPSLSSDDVQQLRALGIDADFIGRAERHGFHHSTVEQLVKLKATGVV